MESTDWRAGADDILAHFTEAAKQIPGTVASKDEAEGVVGVTMLREQEAPAVFLSAEPLDSAEVDQPGAADLAFAPAAQVHAMLLLTGDKEACKVGAYSDSIKTLIALAEGDPDPTFPADDRPWFSCVIDGDTGDAEDGGQPSELPVGSAKNLSIVTWSAEGWLYNLTIEADDPAAVNLVLSALKSAA